jgi:protein-tyrosine phosphatase
MKTDPDHGILDMVNVRDLGGLPTVDGGTTKRHLLYRSESLASVTERDVCTLLSRLGVKNVIDLRSVLEVEHERPTWADAPGVRYQNLPLSDGFDVIPPSLTQEEITELVPTKYLGYLEHARGNILTALESIAEAASRGRSSIFACTYGKDRTGVLAMVVLDLLGVKRSSIIDDYLATAPAMPEILTRMKDHALHGPRILIAPAQIYEANRYSAEAFLRGMDDRGGVEGWAIAAGLSSSRLDRLRNALVAT